MWDGKGYRGEKVKRGRGEGTRESEWEMGEWGEDLVISDR